MIGRIIYGQTCHGTLKYVFGKEGMQILGYGNMFSQDISQRFFTEVLHFQGQRNATKNRYAHISLNLPHGEHLDDSTFKNLSKEYMEQMGYSEQPYVIVRHNDTEHEHVHLVTTNVKEDGKVMDLYNSHRRNMAAQRHLERKYGLSPSPVKKEEKELPLYRLPDFQFSTDQSQGTRYYIQDVLHSVLQKYKVRSFKELERLVKPYHIEIKQTKSPSGRIGVSYGLNNKLGYRTRFINGSEVNRQLSGPKLQKVFDIHSGSKQLPMHRKRLLKQIETTYNLFKTIRPHDLQEVLREYQGINIKLDRKGDTIEGYTIYDKSRYVFRERELDKNIRMMNRLDIFGNGDEPTTIDMDSKQFKLEVKKIIAGAFHISYVNTQKREGLFSEYISNNKPKDILAHLRNLESFTFMERYVPKDQKEQFKIAFSEAYPKVLKELFLRESKKEEELLKNRFSLIGKVLEKQIFEVGRKGGSVRHLFQSLGVRYQNDKLLFVDSDKHSLPAKIGKLDFPNGMKEYVPKTFVRQNHLILEILTEQNPVSNTRPTASAIFLPMVFPQLYERMNHAYKQKLDSVALEAHVQYAARVHAPFEKSPQDYIELFNAKGFYFEKMEEGFKVKSIYTDNSAGHYLSKRTTRYLDSLPNLKDVLQKQHVVINDLKKYGRDNLKNLWVGYLAENSLYNNAAYLWSKENVDPNLHHQILEKYLDNGLKEVLKEALKRQSKIKQDWTSNKGAQIAQYPLRNQSDEHEDVYNGFRLELTGERKRRKKRKGISHGF